MKPKKEPKLKISEEKVLTGCRQFLNLLQNQGKLIYRRVHVMPIVRGGGVLKKYYTSNPDMAGMADLLIFLLNGPTLSVELKSTYGTKSLEQINWGQALNKMGHYYFVVRSIEELVTILEQFNVKL